MSTNYLVEVPKELLPVIGRPDKGIRLYRAKGPAEHVAHWFEAIDATFPDGLVSPGGVSMYAPVSRAAVHKAIKEGRLTAFAFHQTKVVKGWFGKGREKRESPYVYIPVSEAKGWAEILKERALRRGGITRGELEGAKPDWHGAFWEWNDKEHGK